MKALGNYRQLQQQPSTSTERRLAQLAVMQGPRAAVRFVDGSTYSMPSEPLRKLGIAPGGMFILVTEYRGRDIVSVRVELQGEARGSAPARMQPKVMVRDGLKLTTRR
jgi:hypothetical protein